MFSVFNKAINDETFLISLTFNPDHSADNSPLHDIVLQSAPGSPGLYPIMHSNDPNDGTYTINRNFILYSLRTFNFTDQFLFFLSMCR